MLTSKVEKVTFGLLLLLAVVGNCGWPSSNGLAPGCLGQNLMILCFLALTTFATVRFGYTARVILSWFELDWAIGWLLGPLLVACILYFAFASVPQDEKGEEAASEEGA